MARSDTRYSIYPAPKAVELLGDTAPALNQAIECWATLVTRSIADNSRKFSKRSGDPADGQPLDEWGMLAEGLKEVRVDAEFPNPGALLATAVEDAHRVQNIGWNWFDAEHLQGHWDEYDSLREKVIKELIKKVQELDYSHAWALLLTVRWFWQLSAEGADIKNSEWWTLEFRRTWKEKQARKHGSREPKERQPVRGDGRRKRAATSKEATRSESQ
jgi:hypothetical protein